MNDAPAQPEQPVQPTPAQLRPSPDTPQTPSVTPPVQPGPSQISTGTPDESPLTTEAGKKNKFLKPALIVLGIVIVIVISELGYFVYTKSGVGKKLKTEISQFTTPAPESRLRVSETNPPKPIDYEKLTNFVNMLEVFRSKGEFFQDIDINLTASGTVTEIQHSEVEISGIKYVYSLTIKSQSGQAVHRWLTEEQVIESKISLVSSADQKEISISEIKESDFLTIKETINLLDTSPQTKLEFEIRR